MADTSVLNANMFDALITQFMSSDATYGQYATESEHKYYLVEFKDDSEHDFAIYNATANQIAYQN